MIARLFHKKIDYPKGPLFDAVQEAMQGVQLYAISHGGEIELLGVTEEGDVWLRLHGTCKACPLSAVTLKLGVEKELRRCVPGVKKILQK